MLTHTFGMSKVTCMEQSDCGDGRGCSMWRTVGNKNRIWKLQLNSVEIQSQLEKLKNTITYLRHDQDEDGERYAQHGTHCDVCLKGASRQQAKQ